MIFDKFTKKPLSKKQLGMTTVEFSVIAALLLVILFGIIEYALIFVQEHYVANAAREAVRVGVRANNYNYYKGVQLPNAGTVTTIYDRETVIKDTAADYLNVLYNAAAVRAGTSVLTEDVDGILATDRDRVLIVTVSVDNLFTYFTPQLLKLLGSGGDINGPDIIEFSARMELEDPTEFNPAQP